MSASLRTLIQLRTELENNLQPTQGIKTGSTGNSTGSRPPLRIDVLDLIIETNTVVLRWYELARETAHMPPHTHPNIDKALAWIADYSLTTKALDKITDVLNDLTTRIQLAIGELERPLRLQLPCPYCGEKLRAYASTSLVWCTNPTCDCGAEDCKHKHKWKEDDWRRLGLLIQIDNRP